MLLRIYIIRNYYNILCIFTRRILYVCAYIFHNILYRLNHGDTAVYKVSWVVFRVNISLLPFPENSGGSVTFYIILLYVYKTLRRPHQTRINRFVKREPESFVEGTKTQKPSATTVSHEYRYIPWLFVYQLLYARTEYHFTPYL